QIEWSCRMSLLDTSIVMLFIVFTVLGIYWGLIRQVLAIVGLVVGVVLAGRDRPDVGGWVGSFSTGGQLAHVVGFLIVLIAVSAAASLIASLLRIFVGLLFLGWLDHLLGGVLGLFQAVLASAVLLVLAVTFPQPGWEQALEVSRFAGVLLRVG